MCPNCRSEDINFLVGYISGNYKCNKCTIKHGELVFNNVILDKFNNIKLIDMRGKIGNEYTIYGDTFYDFAKIYQSLVGYDII